MNHLGTWAFVVQENEEGQVEVEWVVIEEPGREYGGRVVGLGLHAAILAAYDALGLVCPMVLEEDLLNLAGAPETEEPR